MAQGNGHTPPPAPAEPSTVPPDELEALLAGLFESSTFEVAPGRTLEIRPLLLSQADKLYAGGLGGAALQRYLLAHSVYIGGRPLGEEGAARLPVALANRLVPVVMDANGMDMTGGAGAAEPVDPKA